MVRFSHCDPAGILYTARYFDIFNGVIEDLYSDALGIPYHVMIGERRTGLGYAHTSADFAEPVRMGDRLEVAVIIRKIGNSSITFGVHAFRDGHECVRATFVTVTTAMSTQRSIRLPDDLRQAIESYRAACGPIETETVGATD